MFQNLKTKTTSEPKTPPKRLTVVQLAAAIGISDRALRSCFERGCPRDSVEAIQHWRANNIAEPKNRARADSGLTRLKKRKLREQARNVKIRNDQLESKMILRDAAERVLADLCTAVKNRLEAIPDQIEMEIPRALRATVKRAVAHRIHQALTEMATWRI